MRSGHHLELIDADGITYKATDLADRDEAFAQVSHALGFKFSTTDTII